MQPSKVSFSLMAVAMVIVCYKWGYHSASSSHMQGSEWASVDAESPMTGYGDLSCPTEKEFAELAAKVRLKIPEGTSLDESCDDSDRTKLAKVLKLSSEIRFQFPTKWAPSIQKDFQSILDFIAINSEELNLDLTQKDSIAYNKVSERRIYLGGIFFVLDPYDGVSVLIHEARHSVATSPTHYTCEAGDIPRTAGGCDAEFSISSRDAGAYSYGALFEIALAEFAPGLREADRQMMRSSAIEQITGRFNQLPEPLGRFHDMIYVLSEDNRIQFVDPFSYEVRDLDLKFKNDEYPTRIDHSPRGGQLLILTNKNFYYTWTEADGLKRIFPDKLKDEYQLVHGARIHASFEQKAVWHFYTKENKLIYYDYFPDVNAYSIKDYPVNRHRNVEAQLPILKYFFLGSYKETLFIDKEGRLLSGPHYATDGPFVFMESMQERGPWNWGTGGALYDSLFLINKNGELVATKVDFIEVDESSMPDEKWNIIDTDFKTEAPMKKYLQGTFLEVALDNKGALNLRPYFRQEIEILSLPKPVRDFTIFRKPSVHPEMVYKASAIEAKCTMKMGLRHPWTGGMVGLDERGQLLSSDSKGQCLVLSDWGSGIEKIDWVSDIAGGDGSRPFMRPHLRIFRNGQMEKMFPYIQRAK